MPRRAGRRATAALPRGLLLIAVLLGGTSPVLAADEAAPQPLRWGADAEGGAPYIFKDPNDVHRNIGFEVDLADLLSQELGQPIEWCQYAFKSLTSGLDRRDFDFAMNGLEITPDRLKLVRFSRPYYIYKLQLVARANEVRFDDLETCKHAGGVVGTLEDTAAERLLDEKQIEKRVYDDQVQPYVDLELGRIDAVLLDLPIAVYYARPNPKLKFIGEPLAEGYYAIAFRKDNEALAARFDIALKRLIDNGRLQQVYEKWHIWNDDQLELADLSQSENVVAESRLNWSFSDYFPLLCQSAGVTVQLSVLSMAAAIALGMVIALMRLYGPWPLRALAVGYVEFFRGIPVLLLLFFLYYGLPAVWIELRLPAFEAAILGFGLNYAAYEAEIYRAGIGSIPIGQWEAAASLGMSRVHTFWRIILPQAIRVILPPMTNDFVALFKDTSIVSVIAVVELTKQYQILSKSSGNYLEIGAATAALYLIMSVPLGYLSRYLEKQWGKGHA